MSNNPSPEELRRLQELAEMFDDGPAMPGTPSPEHSAHSPGASEVMNAAKHWGRVFGNKAKELSEKAVEKSKEAQDAIARRAAEAKGKKEAERAQNAAAAIPAAAPTELLQVEPEAISLPVVTETMVESGDEAARLERLAPMKANAKKATKAVRENPAVAALIYDGMGALPQLCDLPDEVVDPVPPYQQSPSVPESNPQGAPGASAVPDHAPNNGLSRTKAWQTLAGAALVVLVLAGATAWWVTRHDSETPTVPAATSTAAAMPPVVVTPSQAPVIDPLPVAVPIERGPAPIKDAKAAPLPVAMPPVEAPAAKPAPVVIAGAKPTPKVSMPPVRQATKPKASVVPAPQPKPNETDGWQEKAEGDMDAWAKKAGIN